jgi:hypothetical protein
MNRFKVTYMQDGKEYQNAIFAKSLSEAKNNAVAAVGEHLISVKPFPTFRLYWEYFGIRGAEFGTTLWEAWDAADAEGEFYKLNHPFRPEHETGYMVNAIEEVIE